MGVARRAPAHPIGHPHHPAETSQSNLRSSYYRCSVR